MEATKCDLQVNLRLFQDLKFSKSKLRLLKDLQEPICNQVVCCTNSEKYRVSLDEPWFLFGETKVWPKHRGCESRILSGLKIFIFALGDKTFCHL